MSRALALCCLECRQHAPSCVLLIRVPMCRVVCLVRGARSANEAGEPVSGALEGSELSVEPKKKGRFLVMEQSGIFKASSQANLSATGSESLSASMTKSRSEAGKDLGLGRPPTAPGSTSSAVLPVASVLPRLQELLDSAAAQQAALARLVATVQDVDRGVARPVGGTMLSRAQSIKADARPAPSSGGGEGGVDAGEAELRMSVDALRVRVAELEAENGRLRARNASLEQAMGGGSLSTVVGFQDLGAPLGGMQVPAGPKIAGEGGSAAPSPRERSLTLRTSEDDRV